MNNLLLRRRALMGMGGKEKSLLPDGYKQIDGIKLVQDAYKSPSIDISCPFIVKIECTILEYTLTYDYNQYNCIFGVNSNLQLAFDEIGQLSVGNVSTVTKIPLNKRILVEGSFNTDAALSFYKIDGEDSTLRRASRATRYYILSAGGIYMTYGTIIHSLEIYKDDSLTHKMLPCIRESENDYGLYDIINDVFINDYLTGA